MDSIKISGGWPSEAFTLTVGDAVVVINDPGQGFGTIPRFGQRRRGKVSRILGRAEAPYFEVVLTRTGEKMLFDSRGSERGKRYERGYGSIERLNEAHEATVASEMRRANEAREIVRDITAAMPHASQIEKLVWTRPDLVPVLRELIEKINAPTASKEQS